MRALMGLLVAMFTTLLWPTLASAELIGTCGNDLCAVSETGKVTRITHDGARRDYSTPSVSRDGNVLGFVANGDLYRGGRRGAKPVLLFDAAAGEARELDLSPDGKSFIFRTAGGTFDGGSFVYESVLRVGGAVGSRLYSSSSEVSVGGFLTSTEPLFTLVPADRSSNNQAVCRLSLIPSNELPPCARRVADDAATNMDDPVGSPNGKLVAVANEDQNANFDILSSRISLFDAASAKRVRDLTTGPADSSPSFSPDGRLVAFTRGHDTWVAPTAGGRARRLARGVVGASWAVRWRWRRARGGSPCAVARRASKCGAPTRAAAQPPAGRSGPVAPSCCG